VEGVALYPPIEPYEHGHLDVGDGHAVYWEQCGNPDGQPAIVLHGGPGSGCTPGHRRLFDPERYRVVLFDQRNSGRSTPHASEPDTDLGANTTWHLVDDIERIRRHLGIDRWLVYGNSWGTTLGLAYAERHPARVSALVLLAVTTTRRSEIAWLYRGVGRFFPEPWERFRAGAGATRPDDDLVALYHARLDDPDPAVREAAAFDWCRWEDAIVAPPDAETWLPRYDDPRFRLAFARIVAHYFHHHAWLDDDILLRDADRLAGIPGVLIHGRLDLAAPLVSAWELARAWPGSQLVVEEAGHLGTDAAMTEAVIAATDRFAKLRGWGSNPRQTD
jgi:proline iminopeptidase